VDGIEQQAHLLGLHDGRGAHLSAEFRAFDEQGGVLRDDLLDDEPVEEATQRRQVPFDGRRGQRL